MKTKQLLCAALTALTVGMFAGCETERGEEHEKQAALQAQAKISRAEAEKIALAQAPSGKIKEGELEKENGKLIWSFDIAMPGSKDIKEVNVDAVTGAVISAKMETPEQEKKEKAGEAKSR